MKADTAQKNFIPKLFFISLALALFSVSLVAAEVSVKYVGGAAQLQRGEKIQRLFYNQKLRPGDVVITGKRAFVALSVSDGSVIKVLANSRFEINRLKTTSSERIQQFTLKIGKIFSFIAKSFKKSDVRFVTPTSIVGVRGTTFIVSTDGLSSQVLLQTGRLQVSSKPSTGQATKSVILNQKEGVDDRGGELKVKKLTDQDIKKANRDVPVSIGSIKLSQVATEALPQQPQKEENKENEEDGKAQNSQAVKPNEDAVKEKGSPAALGKAVSKPDRVVDVGALKQQLRQVVRESVSEINNKQAELNEQKAFERETKKVVNGYQVRQQYRKVSGKEISLISYLSGNNSETKTTLSFVFKNGVPTLKDVNSQNQSAADLERYDMQVQSKGSAGTDKFRYTVKTPKDGEKTEEFWHGEKGNASEVKVSAAQKISDKATGKKFEDTLPEQIKVKFDGDLNEYAVDFQYDFFSDSGKRYYSSCRTSADGCAGASPLVIDSFDGEDRSFKKHIQEGLNMKVGVKANNGLFKNDRIELIILGDFILPLIQSTL